MKFNWLSKKSNGDLICYLCSTRPDESRANDSFVKGWSGTANGYKLENISRHEQRSYHKELLTKHLTKQGELPNAVAPQAKCWTSKISEDLNDQVCNKLNIENWIATEDVAAAKYKSLVGAFAKAKCNVGTTHRNRQGFDIFNSLNSDLELLNQKRSIQNCDCFL